MSGRIAHIGIAVSDLEQAVAVFTDILGQPPDHRETIPGHNVRAVWFNLAGARLELLESTSPESPVGRFIAKHGAGIHHLCFDVADLDGEIARLDAAGYRLVEQASGQGAGDRAVAFLHPKSTAGILVELQQKE